MALRGRGGSDLYVVMTWKKAILGRGTHGRISCSKYFFSSEFITIFNSLIRAQRRDDYLCRDMYMLFLGNGAHKRLATM